MLHTMKKIILTLFIAMLSFGLWAQNDKGAKFVFVSQAVQSNVLTDNKYSIQVGVPLLGQNKALITPPTRTITPADVRFPWDVLYLYSTFSEEFFDVSKGY